MRNKIEIEEDIRDSLWEEAVRYRKELCDVFNVSKDQQLDILEQEEKADE